MQAVAQDWLVLQLTNNPFDLGLVAAVQFTPVMVLGLFGGLIADHLPKRRTLIGTQSVAMTLAFLLAIDVDSRASCRSGTSSSSPSCSGCVNAFDMPTRQSFVVEMVGREDVGNAVALNSAMFNTARIIGPAVAGLAIGVFGVAISFLLNGLSYIAVIWSLREMREADLHSPPPTIPRPHSDPRRRRQPARGPVLCPADADRAPGDPDGRARLDVRNQLQRRDPAGGQGRPRTSAPRATAS